MQIQKINNQTFTSGSVDKDNLKHANIIAELSDNDLKKLSYYKAAIQTDDKKHQKINNAIILTLPVVAALKDTVLSRGNAFAIFGKQIKSSPAARVLTGAKTLGKWYGALAVATGVIAGADKLRNESPKVRQFVKDQPFTAFAAEMVTALALCAGAEKVLPKLAGKFINGKNSAKFWNTITKSVKKFNDNNIVKHISTAYTKAADKMQPALKSVMAEGLLLSPLILTGCGILHSFNHSSVRNRQAEQNYINLKTVQAFARAQNSNNSY